MGPSAMRIEHCKTFLFVPANRTERIAKAIASDADAVIVDLEDAVAPDAKDGARKALSDWLNSDSTNKPVLVRVNAVDTPWYSADLDLCRARRVNAIMLPKAESADDIARTHAATLKPILPIIESALGVYRVLQIAQTTGCVRLVFGKIDLAVDLSLDHGDDDPEEIVFQPYRAQLVLASRLAGLPPPVDGVFTALDHSVGLTANARRARRDGFGAMLLIHPCQAAPVTTSLNPSSEQLAWARSVLSASDISAGNAATVGGQMIDAPVIARAKRLLESRPSN